MKVIEYANKNPKLECRVIAANFNIRKTSASNILKNAKTLQKKYEFFKGNCKQMRHGQYQFINEILTNWYKKYIVQVYFQMALC